MPNLSPMHKPYLIFVTYKSIKKEACWTTTIITTVNKDQIQPVTEANPRHKTHHLDHSLTQSAHGFLSINFIYVTTITTQIPDDPKFGP